MSLDCSLLREAIVAERFHWCGHALQRVAERGIPQKAVLSVLLSGEKIRDYPDDSPYPSALFLGWHEGRPLHVVAAWDKDEQHAYIITAYEPGRLHFEDDFRTRRRGR